MRSISRKNVRRRSSLSVPLRSTLAIGLSLEAISPLREAPLP
jgi:hypothetical protein